MKTPPVSPQLLTFGQVAEALQASHSSVERLVRDGRLDAVRVGRLRRIPLSVLEAFVAGELAEQRAERERVDALVRPYRRRRAS